MTENLNQLLDRLCNQAVAFGANEAKPIPVRLISVEDEVAAMCRPPACPHYGKSVNCPPEVMPPEETRKLLSRYHHAVLFKIEVPPKKLASDTRFPHFRKVYQIATQLEQLATEAGYTRAQAFAAGSCHAIFCPEKDCAALVPGQTCRFPALARPSMEAVGMNVFKLVREVGWEIYFLGRDTDPKSIPKGVLVGLVLVD